MRRLPLLNAADLPAAVAAAIEVVAAGGVVLLPTETFYGLGTAPDSQPGVDRIYALKGRPRSLALPVLCADWSQVKTLVCVPERFRVRLSRSWPGPLTVILPGRSPLAAAPAGTVAVRIPGLALLRALLYRIGPLTGTSANRHGQGSCSDPDFALASLAEEPDLVLDGGTTPGVVPSTLVDLGSDQPKVLRVGGASWL